MIRLSLEDVLELHTVLTEATGGDPGLRDRDLLESALESAFQTFGGDELYPSLEEKSARLGYALISNHAFVDGNKRIGIYVMLTFARVNGLCLRATPSEVARVGWSVASGEMGFDALLSWVRECSPLGSARLRRAASPPLRLTSASAAAAAGTDARLRSGDARA